MKKRKRMAFFCTILSAILLVGCGTPMHEMTSEEEEIIVRSAAEIVSKYNIRQKDGMNWVKLEEESEDTQQEDTTQSGENNHSSGGTQGDSTPLEEISFADAIGYGGKLNFQYEGFQVMNFYSPAEGFVVNPSDGKKLVLLTFSMKNISKDEVSLQMSSSGVLFEASFQGGAFIPEKESLVSFTNRDGKLKAGETEKIVLMFEVGKDKSEDISGVILRTTKDGKKYSVKL